MHFGSFGPLYKWVIWDSGIIHRSVKIQSLLLVQMSVSENLWKEILGKGGIKSESSSTLETNTISQRISFHESKLTLSDLQDLGGRGNSALPCKYQPSSFSGHHLQHFLWDLAGQESVTVLGFLTPVWHIEIKEVMLFLTLHVLSRKVAISAYDLSL